MKSPTYPSLNIVFAAFVIIAGVLGGGFIVYYGVYNSSNWMASVLAAGIGLATAAGSILIVYRASRLRLNNDGLSSGAVAFQWREVTEVRKIGFGLHVLAGDRKIVIAPYAYATPDQVVTFVDTALKQGS